MIEQLVEYLAQGVVERTADVKATGEQKPGRVDVVLEVASQDFGRVIGRNGQMIGAIRTLAAFAGQRQGLDVSIEVAEPKAAATSKNGDEDGD